MSGHRPWREGANPKRLNTQPELALKPTHRPLSSSFLGLPYRILNMNQKKELLRGLWVASQRLHQRSQTHTSESLSRTCVPKL